MCCEKYRIEKDSMGEVLVNKDKLWGAQTQRSLNNFKIGIEKIPKEVIKALICIKKSCAKANFKLGKLDKEKCNMIVRCAEIAEHGDISKHFPLSVWQTGSGTQTNMNVNEVIANLCNKENCDSIHPNDHVNMSQSSNDVFPSAMKISALVAIESYLIPATQKLIDTLKRLEN